MNRKMKGRWYGVGVGPGDPELMTLKAVRILRECSVVAIPHSEKERCAAYQIAAQAAPEIEEKTILYLPMPMTRDRDRLGRSHQEAAARTAAVLDEGRDVAFITLGDSTVYSTCLYVMGRLQEQGYETELINGVPSFCAAAARLGIPLVNGAEELHVIPASYPVREALGLAGVKVFMKAGTRISELKKLLEEQGCRAVMVENCGMKTERVYGDLKEIPEDAGYFSLLVAR